MPLKNSPNRGRRSFRWISSCFNYRSNHRLQQKAAAAASDKTAPLLQPYLSSDDCCPICLGKLIGGAGGSNNVKVLPRCAHVFHAECIGEWLPFRSHNCPVCREPAVTEEDLRHELIKKVATDAIATSSVQEYANHFSNMYSGYFILVS